MWGQRCLRNAASPRALTLQEARAGADRQRLIGRLPESVSDDTGEITEDREGNRESLGGYERKHLHHGRPRTGGEGDRTHRGGLLSVSEKGRETKAWKRHPGRTPGRQISARTDTQIDRNADEIGNPAFDTPSPPFARSR